MPKNPFQNINIVLGSFMVCLFLAATITFLFTDFAYEKYPRPYRTYMALFFLVYTIYRGYRVYVMYKKYQREE